MRTIRLLPWGRRSSESSKRPKSSKRDNKSKNVEHESSNDTDSNSDNEGITTKERQTNSPFQGLGNGLWDVGRFVVQALWNPHVWYLILWALFVFICIQFSKWLDPRAAVDSFSGTLKMFAMAQAGWPAVGLAVMEALLAFFNWWSTDSKNRTTSTIPQARFISPISAEEAFATPALEDSFRRAMKEAELFKEIHDGLMTDVKLRFAGHYDQLGQLHIDIERAIIDIDDRNETKMSYFGGLFTTDQPYARARSHHRTLLSIINDMIETSKSERDRLIKLLKELRAFETHEEPHGAICGLRSETLKSIQRWTKDTKDIRAEVKVMCNSSKRFKVKLWMMLEALRDQLVSINAVLQGLRSLQHDQAKTLEAALLSYCKSLLEAMRRLAEYGNG
ncbi:hypothetical protein NCS56_00662400 [Fusarium sp. Ph1]|nr:hypothetical protein NCS56_00662400 [Fusarium sp. Ph1]